MKRNKTGFSCLASIVTCFFLWTCRTTTEEGSTKNIDLLPLTKNYLERIDYPAPFLVRYEHKGKSLSFVVAERSQSLLSKTFLLIREEFEKLGPQIIVVEGIKTIDGLSTPKYKALLTSLPLKKDQWQTFGETGYAVNLALEKDIKFLGGEPSEREIKDYFEEAHYGIRDLHGFSFLKDTALNGLTENGVDKLFIEESQKIAKSYEIRNEDLMNFEQFKGWYKEKNKKEFKITTDLAADLEIYPGASFSYTQNLSLLYARIRSTNLIKVLEKTMAENERVLVVFNATNYYQLESMLQQLFGVPVEYLRL